MMAETNGLATSIERFGQIFIGVPRGSQPRLHAFESNLRRILFRLHEKGLGGPDLFYQRGGARVDNNRNNIVRKFLESDAQFLLQLDDDMTFHVDSPELLRAKLLSLRAGPQPDAGVICGMYFQNKRGCYPHFYGPPHEGEMHGEKVLHHPEMADGVAKWLLENGGQGFDDHPYMMDPETPSLMQIRAGGTGFMMAHREVFEKTPQPWFREMGHDPYEMGYTGGDLAFFHRAHAAGFSIWGEMGTAAAHWMDMPSGVETFLNSNTWGHKIRERQKDIVPEILDVVIVSAYPERGAESQKMIDDQIGGFVGSVMVSGGPYEIGWHRKANAGLLAARAQYVLLINDDVEIDSESVMSMVEELETDAKIGAIGPTIACRTHQRYLVAAPKPVEAPFLVSGCVMFRNDMLDEVGIYPEVTRFGAMDIDHCLRMRSAGWKVVWDQSARAEHELHDDSQNGPEWHAEWAKSHRLLHEKWGRGRIVEETNWKPKQAIMGEMGRTLETADGVV